jgi:hypothetical protein
MHAESLKIFLYRNIPDVVYYKCEQDTIRRNGVAGMELEAWT